MERRQFVGASTAALLAGCGDSQSEPETSENGSQDSNNTVENGTAEQVSGDAEVVLLDSRWIENRSAVEFQVRNQGSEPSGAISVTLSWFDTSGNYIGNDTVGLGGLHDGANWIGAVEPRVRFEAYTYDISVDYASSRRSQSDDVELLEYEFVDDKQAIVGRVENLTSDYLAIQGQVSTYSSVYITHTGTVSDSSVPPEETWLFYFPLAPVDYSAESVGSDVDIRFIT
jgi:hypothetical protein